MFAPRQFVRSSPAKSVSALRSLTRCTSDCHAPCPPPNAPLLLLGPQTRPMSSSPSAAAERIEQDANRMPNNAMKQAELYSSWNRNSQPWQTIRRFETGQYAANEAATREYLTALAGVQRLDRVVPTLLQHQQELSANVNAVDSMAYGPAASTSYPGSASSMYGGPTGSMFQGNGGAAASASSTFNPFASSAAVSSGAVPFNNPTVHSSSSAKAPSGTDAEPVHVVMQEPCKSLALRLVCLSLCVCVCVCVSSNEADVFPVGTDPRHDDRGHLGLLRVDGGAGWPGQDGDHALGCRAQHVCVKVQVLGRRGRGRGKAGADGGRRVPARPAKVYPVGRQTPQGHPSDGAPRHRQDALGQDDCWRGGCALFLLLWLRV